MDSNDISAQKKVKNPSSVSVFLGRFLPHIVVGIIFTVLIFMFSGFMSVVAHERNNIVSENFESTSKIYNGTIEQESPVLNSISMDSDTYRAYTYSNQKLDATQIRQKLASYAENANITSTKADVKIRAEFVKKGLNYQPTFRTNFQASYVLVNKLNEVSVISFEFPFPFSVSDNEISNVRLLVNGKVQEKSKAKISGAGYGRGGQIDGLKWEGKVPANGKVDISVSYDTVGIDGIRYSGFENSSRSQDFAMKLSIEGTRLYDVRSGLTVDKRTFGESGVVLEWDKKDLFSTPSVDVTLGEKLAPGTQVARVYYTMTPIYMLFAFVLVWLSTKYKKLLQVKDMILMSILYLLYFPLLHYVVSFTVDPTLEVFSGIKDVPYYSMPIYGAFAISLSAVGVIMMVLLTNIYGKNYSLKAALPLIVMCLGFFPLVITVPEYSILMVLVGLIISMFMFVLIRLRDSRMEDAK